MDIPEKMDQLNQVSSSSLTNKRKRGPSGDECQTQQQVNQPVTTVDENLIGQVVSGVVEGTFEAGYFLNLKVADTEKQLKGVIFLPGRVAPVTPTTDLFPQAKMYTSKHIPVPSLNQQTPSQGKKDVRSQTDDLIADKNQSTTLLNDHPMSDAGVDSEAMGERSDPTDTEIKDVGGSSAKEKINEPEGLAPSLMPQLASDDVPKEDHTSLRSEACAISKTGGAGTGGLDLIVEGKTDSPFDNVPEEVQLKLDNKKMSASAIATEANPDQSAASKSGLLENLCEGKEETIKEEEKRNAASASDFPEATSMQADGNDS